MIKAELIKRSPLRILEKSTHGGLGKGNLGVIAARKGVGKTAVLVHLSTDQLFQGKHVIHVSFSSNTQHIIDWYEDIFKELARQYELDAAMKVHDEVIKNRVIMNFNQEGVKVTQILKSLKAMIKDGSFAADVIIVDGYDFAKTSDENVKEFSLFAQELGIEIWFSASLKQSELDAVTEQDIPTIFTPFLKHIAIFIMLKSKNGYVNLELKKDHDIKIVDDLHLKLDPKILLISTTM
jgi:archaellum biogenesis ATPase FlaH